MIRGWEEGVGEFVLYIEGWGDDGCWGVKLHLNSRKRNVARKAARFGMLMVLLFVTCILYFLFCI